MFYVESNGDSSCFYRTDYGTVQGSVLGPVLFCKNILLNRLHAINNKVEKHWINLSIDSYKVKCKELFLKS